MVVVECVKGDHMEVPGVGNRPEDLYDQVKAMVDLLQSITFAHALYLLFRLWLPVMIFNLVIVSFMSMHAHCYLTAGGGMA